MFGYYLYIALHSLKKSPVLSGLMVLAIGLGIGASMTMVTVLDVMSGDPLPHLSAELFVPTLDPLPEGQVQAANSASRVTFSGLTWPDAMNLLREHHAGEQAAMSAGSVMVQPARVGLHPFLQGGEYVTADFFRMFGVPFQSGAGWTSEQDHERAKVVVLNAHLDHRLFGDTNGIGQTVRLDDVDFRVIGVLNQWDPQPTFYEQRGNGSFFGRGAEFFLPLQTAVQLNLAFNGDAYCWDNGTRRNGNCAWLQYWVRLKGSAKIAEYKRYLSNYWRYEQEHGRFLRTPPPKLYGLMQWLARERVIPASLSMQMWLAIGFLVVCMLCVMALLLAKFLGRSGEIGVRRALGARRRDIFLQFGIESAVIGAIGSLLGLVIAQLGLWSVRQRPDGYAHLAHMNISMLISTIALAIVASTLAGLIPAWRACEVPPALQLKTQ